MAQPYVGEIRMFAGNFAPAGWMFCENETLFNLIATTYGGDGQSTFALPDLRGRIPVHMGNGVNLAESGGAEAVTLTVQQIPAHSHPALATLTQATETSPANAVVAESRPGSVQFFQDVPNVNMAGNMIAAVGGSQPHANFQPYLCINFIISLFGIFPSQT